MEIARLTAILRKAECGPLENELVRLRAQIATLEEGNADLEERRGCYESEYEFMEKQLALSRRYAKLEEEEKEKADLKAQLWKWRRLISRPSMNKITKRFMTYTTRGCKRTFSSTSRYSN
jgi:hypothetical protein